MTAKQVSTRQFVVVQFLMALAVKMFMLPALMLRVVGKDSYIVMLAWIAFEFIDLTFVLLLARRIDNDDRTHFAVMDVAAVRNAYGRQLGSFSATADFDGVGRVPAVFIRAPYITRTFGGARALASVDGRIVAARQGNMLATAFHPELSGDTSVHRYFLERIAAPANRP